ncbi:hypothetical protein SH2C18_47910 [Clostridium sediminicola]
MISFAKAKVLLSEFPHRKLSYAICCTIILKTLCTNMLLAQLYDFFQSISFFKIDLLVQTY